jgi:threonine dehydrogenase-like Zn-dependent dehydrogenase
MTFQPSQVGEPRPPAIAAAPRFLGRGQIAFADGPVPVPGPGQLLLRVAANAICGSDREVFQSGSTVIPGHETAGVVAVAGPKTAVATGTRGVVYLMDFCGRCRSCRGGFTNQCLAKRGDFGFTRDGGYGPYELIHETCFFPVPDDVGLAEATMLLDVMGTSGHAIARARRLRPDIESVYIAGAGPIGLGLLVMCAITLGPDVAVRISDVSAWRLEYARSLGAEAIDARDPDALRGLPEADVAFDSTGRRAARQVALSALGRRGVLVCAGHGETLELSVSADLIAPERAVLGTEYFCVSELPRNLELLRANRELISKMITHTFDVRDIAEAFAVFLSGTSAKVIVTQGSDQ